MVLFVVFGCGSRSDRDKGIGFYRIPSVIKNKSSIEEELKQRGEKSVDTSVKSRRHDTDENKDRPARTPHVAFVVPSHIIFYVLKSLKRFSLVAKDELGLIVYQTPMFHEYLF